MLRQRRMVGKVARIGERGARDRRGGGCLLHTVQLIVQVGDGEWTLPSALSADGETVAALAVHIDEAELKAESSCGAAGRLPDNLLIAAPKPTSRSRRRFGRGCGGRMPCTKRDRPWLSFYTAPAAPPFRVRETIAVILRGFIADGVRRSGASGRPSHQSLLQNQTYVLTGSVIRMAGPAIRRRKRQRIADQRGHRPHSSRRRTTLPRDGCRRRPPRQTALYSMRRSAACSS